MLSKALEFAEKIYTKAILISNTCDLDLNNKRVIPKEVVLAPISPFNDFVLKYNLWVSSILKM